MPVLQRNTLSTAWLVVLSIFLVCAIIPSVNALYPDQAGLLDWHKRLTGIPRYFNVHRQDKRTNLFVASEKNAIALLNPKSGQIDVVTVTGGEKTRLRRWDASNGFLLWDVEITGPPVQEEVALGFVDLVGSQKDVVVLTPLGVLARYGGTAGKKLWFKELPSGKTYLALAVSPKGVYVLATDASGQLEITTVNAQDGKVIKTTPSFVAEGVFFVDDPEAVSAVKTLEGGSVEITLLESGKSVTLKSKDVFGVSEALEAKPFFNSLPSDEFILTAGTLSGIFSLKATSGKPELVTKVKFAPAKPSEVSRFAMCIDGAEKVAARFSFVPGASAGALELATLSNGKVFDAVKFPINPKFGDVEKIFLEAAFKPDTAPAYRLFLQTASGTVVAAKANELLWTRYESLAATVSSVFIDLPEERLLSLDHDELNEPVKDSEALGPFARYLKRWGTHIQQLQAFAKEIPDYAASLSSLPATLFASKNTSVSNEVTLKRDKHGFRKLLIFGSKSGNVIGLETGRGNVAWSTYFPGVEIKQIERVRSAVVRYPPVVVVVGLEGENTKFFYLNALTGEFLNANEKPDGITYEGIPAQVIKLPVQEEKDGLYPLLVIGKDLQATLLPNTPEANAAFKTIIKKFYYYLTKPGSTGINGYIVSEEEEGKYISKPAWQVAFSENEKLAALAPRSVKEQVASMGRVLGNRQVLYKYLNPNVLAVATLRETEKTSNLFLYMIDTVTGSIFHRSSFPGAGNVAKGVNSIYLTQTEHLVILSFYNHGPDHAEAIVEPEEDPIVEEEEAEGKKKKRRRRKARRVPTTAPDVKGHEVVVFEVFENIKPNARMESKAYSSFAPARPQVQSQSFVFPIPITAIGFTDTRAGITTLGLQTNQVYGINKRFLDVRRPLGQPSSDDREEGLIPYRPVLDYNPREVMSYNLDIAGVEKIVSSPSEIESTSLVAAYGLDLFFTRRAPSKVFDVLSEDFNYLSLILTIVALVIGIQVAKYFSTRKRLFDQWT
ncbi:hypothetical protein HDU96_009126 [Phlyctochytrium bullatum]|nr:hypothetical protein HDU96_009126 [Phlyctochytrium bullatum]